METIAKIQQIFIRLHIYRCNRHRSNHIFLPSLMGWVNFPLFTDPVANKFTSQFIIIGKYQAMFSMDLPTTDDDSAQRPFDICIGSHCTIFNYALFLAFLLQNYYTFRWNRTD